LAAPVYSTRLALANLSTVGTTYTLVTAPAGERLVVKFVTTAQASSAGAQILFYIAPSNLETLRVLPTTSGATAIQTMLVIHEHESLLARPYVTPAVVSCHGYIFQGAGGPVSLLAFPPTAYEGEPPAPPNQPPFALA
jgi:hypothetical protein